MGKIDNSTYKAIKKDKKNKDTKTYGRGKYGHSKHHRNLKISMAVGLLLLILLDVIFSLVVFHTRKTVFVIVACVLSLPFARNVIDIFMSLKAAPLSEEEYQKTNELSENTGIHLYYDISVTEEEGMYYIPCAAVCNNNIICYTPNITDTKMREKLKGYVNEINTDEINVRVFLTEKYSTFEKEIKKLKNPDGTQAALDREVLEKLLSMGF